MVTKYIRTILRARLFTWAIVLFFIFEAVWIALSAAYPMAFDEDFHFGIIKVYSHYWLPFLTSQPPHADMYGAVARDPSFLYHYLMSFPYRLLALWVHSQTLQVIYMRLLNIALFTGGLLVFRRVLLHAKLSVAMTNLILFIFIFIPIMPQLAGQINYDNLLFLLTAWTCLLTLKVIDGLQQKQLCAPQLLLLLSLGVSATLVQYEYLPILVSIVLFLGYMTYRQFRGQTARLGSTLRQSWQSTALWLRVALIVFFLLGAIFFVERDGFNLIRYHTFTPDCQKVLSVKQCSAYSVWKSSYDWHKVVVAHKATTTFHNPLSYTALWFYWLWYRLFFAVNGPADQFRNYPPLPLPALGAALLALASPVVTYKWWRRQTRPSPYISFFLLAIVLYMLALWVEGYLRYRYTHVLVLMNGRYLLPILLPAAVILGKACSGIFRSRVVLKGSLALIVMVLFLEGGGLATFIMRSDKAWDWKNTTVVRVNNDARDVLRPVVLAGPKGYDTSYWVFN